MQSEPLETSKQVPQADSTQNPSSSAHDGFVRPCQVLSHDGSASSDRGVSPRAGQTDGAESAAREGIDASQLDARLSRLSGQDGRPQNGRSELPGSAGQRIAEYERAMTPINPRKPLGFKVVKRPDSSSNGTQLQDFPNEILTHILSHLHPDSHSAVALVSKRFYALVTEPHAWRMAFIRFFPGQEALTRVSTKPRDTIWGDDDSDLVRSDVRLFTRLTLLASWRSEYLLRTRLLRSVSRGKPGTTVAGGIGSAAKSGSSKRASAVLTYPSKLPWLVTNLHAVFANGKKGPKVIHGSSDYCIGTVSDPTNGKVEKWGMEDPFSAASMDEMFPNLRLYGLDDHGATGVPNVMDVSQPYGLLGGEGFPGGRVFFRPSGEARGRYLEAQDNAIVDQNPQIPKIPELSEAISCVWIAKSSAVPSMTHSLIGMMTGSTLGVVTSYSLGYDSSGPRFNSGDITCRWVLSPGVPIVALKVDDGYSTKRKALGRVWAVALNALGEVFYLNSTPTPALARGRTEDLTRDAWLVGRTVYWELIEKTRRTAQPDEDDKNVTRGTYSPRSPSNAMKLSKGQLVAEAREIEKFLRYKPVHFRNVCEGWDMRRRLEVDFGGGSDLVSGEGIFVITCGHSDGQPSKVTRYTRGLFMDAESPRALTPTQSPKQKNISLFGGQGPSSPSSPLASSSPQGAAKPAGVEAGASNAAAMGGWQTTVLSLKGHHSAELTASGIDMTTCALLCDFEDPLNGNNQVPQEDIVSTPTSKNATGEIPGRRARFLAVGTKGGAVIVWNMRDPALHEVLPVRTIQTDSPEVSTLAVSALYLVHGGSDGLVQAWDPLASTLEPVRTLNSRSSGRVPRHLANANPAVANANFAAVGAIFLDPNPTVLRGVLAFGAFIRYWTYSSTGQTASRKRRLRHSDIHGRLGSRRQGGTVHGYIAAEEAELRREQDHQRREQARLRSRFGVGALGDLTEEEAIRYAQMISQESFVEDEQRRTSASDTGSAADIGETASSSGYSADTVTPEPSLSGRSPSVAGPSAPAASAAVAEESEDDYELQIQRALRLSLLEGVNDAGQSPRDNSSTEFEFQVRERKPRSKKSSKKGSGSSAASRSPPSQAHTPLAFADRPVAPPSRVQPPASVQISSVARGNSDDDLELALRLSLEDEQNRRTGGSGPGLMEQDFPALQGSGKGKGNA